MAEFSSHAHAVVVVVLVHIRPGQEGQYRVYEQQAEEILAEYGGEIQQVITPYATAGDIATPDELQIISFPDHAALAAYQSDPRMVALRNRRDSSVTSTVMILGRPAARSGK